MPQSILNNAEVTRELRLQKLMLDQLDEIERIDETEEAARDEAERLIRDYQSIYA